MTQGHEKTLALGKVGEVYCSRRASRLCGIHAVNMFGLICLDRTHELFILRFDKIHGRVRITCCIKTFGIARTWEE